MKYLKAFMAGIVVPTILLPFFFGMAMLAGKGVALSIPALHFLPLIWGIWNILYFAFFQELMADWPKARSAITGAVLGLLVAVYGVFFAHVPSLMGFPETLQYAPLIILPVVYGLLWYFAVRPLNAIVGLPKD